jgi:hypothetical protein
MFVFVLVLLPKYCLCLTIRNRLRMRVAVNFAIFTRSVTTNAAACIRAVDKFIMAIPYGVASVGYGAILQVNQ